MGVGVGFADVRGRATVRKLEYALRVGRCATNAGSQVLRSVIRFSSKIWKRRRICDGVMSCRIEPMKAENSRRLMTPV